MQATKDRVSASARRLVGALLRPQPGHSYSVGLKPWVIDQGDDPSCTGYNAAGVIYGLTGEQTSPEMLWHFGLLIDGEPLGAMTRRGLPVSAILRAAREHGSCGYESWNRHLPEYDFGRHPGALLRAEAQRFNMRAQPLSRAVFCDGLADGIMRKRPGGVVVEVDEAFDNAGSGVVGPQSGPSRGRHVITTWDVECTPSGRRIYTCVNSWSKRWGVDGLVRLSEERVAEAPYAYVGVEVS